MKKNIIFSLILLSASIAGLLTTAHTAQQSKIYTETHQVIYLHEQEDAQTRSKTRSALEKYINSYANIIVIFYEDWCPPCQRMTPIFEELAQEIGDKIVFLKLKREFYRSIFNDYKLSTVPAILFFRDGMLMKVQPSSLSKNELVKIIKKIYY